MRFLRTNTACRITVGPFFDKADGVTPETTLTVTSCKLTFMVDDGNVPTLVIDAAPTASGGNNDMVHVTGDDAGFYDLELTAANTNYLGRAMLAITDAATHCPVFHEFMILPAVVYDALVLGTDNLQVDTVQVTGTAQTARDLGASVLLSSGTGTGQISLAAGLVTLAGVTHTGAVIPTVTTTATATNVTTVNGLAAGVITAASIAADAITDAKVASDVTIASVTGAVGSVTGAVGSVTGNVGGNVAGSVGSISGVTFPTNFSDLSISVTTGLVDITQTAADKVWSTTTRRLSDSTNIVLAKGVGVTGFNDLSAAQVNTEVDTALADYDGPTNTEMVAAFTEIKGVTWATTDTLEAIRDRGDAAWITATGFATAVSLTTVEGKIDTIDGIVDTILADTAEIGLAGAGLTALAPAATALSTATWSNTRAVYLDNLSGGAVMLAASYSAPPSAATISTQVASDLATAHGAGAWATATGFSTFNPASDTVILNATQSNYAPAKAGDAMTLTSGERTAVANEVEAQIIDDTDAEKVLTAITDKIASVNPDLGGLTVAAIASASATSVWGAVTRTLSAGTNIVLAKGTGITGFNDLSAAAINAEVDTALADVGLTTIVTSRIDAALSTRATPAQVAAQVAAELATYDGPTNAEMVARTLVAADYATAANQTTILSGIAGMQGATFDTATDSLEALRNRGDTAWGTATGFSTFNPATDVVAHVTLVDTCATNSDMRGTDNAAVAGDAMTLTSGERTTLAAAVWNALTSGFLAVGSIGKRIVDFLTGDAYTRLGAPTGESIAADIAALAVSATVPTASEIADEVQTRTIHAVSTVTALEGWDTAAIVAILEATQTTVQQIHEHANADQYIDTSTVPWCMVDIQAGTGGIGTGVEIMRKRLQDINGVNIVSTGIVPGRVFE